MAVKKFPTMVTPKGLAAYSWLVKKDTKFDKDGVYKVSVVLDKKDISVGRVEFGKETMPGAAWVKNILAICKEHGVPSKPGEKGCPIKDGDKLKDKDGNPKEAFKGKLLLQFKTTYKPEVIDTKGNTLPKSVQVLNGDLIKVAFNPVYREVSGNHYLSLYLSKVQLVEKLVESMGAEVFGDDEDGYVVPEDQRDTNFGDDEHEENDDSDDDNHDF